MRDEWRGRPLAVWALMALVGTLGIRGCIGVSTAVLAPTSVSDFLVPGLALFVGLGLAPLIVLYGLYRDNGWALGGTSVIPIGLAGWAILEGVVLGCAERLQYLDFGQAIAMLILAVHCHNQERQRGDTSLALG